jgi:hypothetical protein
VLGIEPRVSHILASCSSTTTISGLWRGYIQTRKVSYVLYIPAIRNTLQPKGWRLGSSECLPSKYKALSSNCSTAKTKNLEYLIAEHGGSTLRRQRQEDL